MKDKKTTLKMNKKKNNTLTPKQQLFCKEYLIDLNGTQAAIRAGYSEKTAQQISSRLLLNVVIQEEISRLMKKRAERTEITQDMVVKELAKLGFTNMRNYAKWGPDGVQLVASELLTEDQVAAVLEVVEKYNGSRKIKLYDKAKVLELLGRHLGMFSDRIDVKLSDLPAMLEEAMARVRKSREEGK